MPVRKIQIGGSAAKLVDRLIKGGFEPAQIRAYVLERLAIYAQKGAGHVIKTQLSGGFAPAYTPTDGAGSKQQKRRRSGNLARAIIGGTAIVRGAPAFEIGLLRSGGKPVNLYGTVQEYGTQGLNPDSPVPDIKPKSAGALAVPAEPARYPSGDPRFDGPRDYPEDLAPIYFRTPRGKHKNVTGILVLRAELDAARSNRIASNGGNSTASLQAIYYLLNSIKIRPGYFLSDGVRDYLPQIVEGLARDLTREFIAGGKA